jgi:microcin C transport system substrate-binding protein
MDAYDFDMLVRRHAMSATPGEGLRGSFSSQAAGMRGTYNLAGIADPVVDALIETIVAAQSREALTVAGMALDRVLRAGHYWIPQWYKANHWLAYWNVYDHPVTKPRYGRAVPDIWWWKGEAGASSRD